MADQSPVRILASRTAAPLLARELSRRRFLSAAAMAGGAAFLAACSPSGAQTSATATGGGLEDSLSIYTWGEYDPPELLKAFTADLGPQITLDSFSSNEELVAKLVAARGTGGYDIVVPSGLFVPQMIENDLLAVIDKSLIPNLSHMDAAYLGRSWDPNNDYTICKAWGTTGFVYDKTVITRELTTWGDFLDAAQNEASGNTAVLDDPAEIAGLYFWANGIDWRTTDRTQLDACEDYLVNTLAPHISSFDSYSAINGIPTGSLALLQTWNGDARWGILSSPEPERWQWVLPGPATELWMDNWAISASAPHPEAAHAFIDYILSPDSALAELDYHGYHTGAKDLESIAEAEQIEMRDLIFFTAAQLATMQDGEVTSAHERLIDIWNKARAAAAA